MIGGHEADSCLIAYDRTHARSLAADCRRRQLSREDADPDAHHMRARRIFGFVVEQEINGRGRITIPPMMLRRSGITDSALLVGAGGNFEIWNPQVALEGRDPDLRELAGFHLDDRQAA